MATTFIAIVGGLTVRWGWRPALLALGGAAAVATAVAGRSIPVGLRGRTSRHSRAPLPARFWVIAVGGFCMIAGSQPLYAWFAAYLHDAEGISTGGSTLIGGVCTAAGVPAMLGSARLSDRLGAPHRARFLSGLCLVLAVVLTVVSAMPAVGVPVAVVAVGVGIAANLSFAGLFPALIVECAPASVERGTGVAMTGYFLGALASPVGFGAVSDAAGYQLAWALAAGMCVAAAATFLRIARWAAASGAGAVGAPDADGPVVA